MTLSHQAEVKNFLKKLVCQVHRRGWTRGIMGNHLLWFFGLSKKQYGELTALCRQSQEILAQSSDVSSSFCKLLLDGSKLLATGPNFPKKSLTQNTNIAKRESRNAPFKVGV